MEFDKITPASDADRRLAEAKKLTLEPLHTDIAPEAEPDATVVARHLTEGALANVSNDTEQAGMPVQPSKGLLTNPDGIKPSMRPKTSFVILVAIVVLGGVCVGLGLTLFR